MNSKILSRFFQFSLFSILAALLISCEEVDQNALQEQYLEEKISEYRAFQDRNCQKRVAKEANQKADSFFMDMAKKQSYDSVQRPALFTRPRRPEIGVREDSMPLSPIVKPEKMDSVALDSTLIE